MGTSPVCAARDDAGSGAGPFGAGAVGAGAGGFAGGRSTGGDFVTAPSSFFFCFFVAGSLAAGAITMGGTDTTS